eukprot:gb/GECG01011220.1/.p1 GENE.gb/GECG01011220.1/~~gb/GECG01011220.1/.p1  ORF type:complete len:1034 (+),score=104.92 gb/GECG01011220.1/:1-3102(+)
MTSQAPDEHATAPPGISISVESTAQSFASRNGIEDKARTESVLSEYDDFDSLRGRKPTSPHIMPSVPSRMILAFRGGLVGFLSSVWCLHPQLGDTILQLRVLVPLLAVISGMAPTKGISVRLTVLLLVAVGSAALYVACWFALFGSSEVSATFAILVAGFTTYSLNVRQPVQKVLPGIVAILTLIQFTTTETRESDVWQALGSASLGCLVGVLSNVIPLPLTTSVPISSNSLRLVEDTSCGELHIRLQEATTLTNLSFQTAVQAFGMGNKWSFQIEEECGSESPKTPQLVEDSSGSGSGVGSLPRFRLTQAFLANLLHSVSQHLYSIAALKLPSRWEERVTFRSWTCRNRLSADELNELWSDPLFKLSRILRFITGAIARLEEVLQERSSANRSTLKNSTLRKVALSYMRASHPFIEEVTIRCVDCLDKARRVGDRSFHGKLQKTEVAQALSSMEEAEARVAEAINRWSQQQQKIRSELFVHSSHLDTSIIHTSPDTEYDMLTKINCVYAFFLGVRRYAEVSLFVSRSVKQKLRNKSAEGEASSLACQWTPLKNYLKHLKPDNDSLKYALKATLSLMLASSLSLIPALRARLKFAHWAAAAVAFVASRAESITYQQGISRLQGTAVGSAIGFLVLIFGDGRVWASAIAMSIFIGLCYGVYANGEQPLSDAARVAAFTSGIIALSSHEDSSSASEAALFRVLTNVLGVIILLAVMMSILRQTASDSVWATLEHSLNLLSRALDNSAEEITYSLDAKSCDEDRLLTSSATIDRVHSTLDQCKAFLPQAETEPLQWSLPFDPDLEGAIFRSLVRDVQRATRATAAINQCCLQLEKQLPFETALMVKQMISNRNSISFNMSLCIIIAETCAVNLVPMKGYVNAVVSLLKEVTGVLSQGRATRLTENSYKRLQDIERKLHKAQICHSHAQHVFENTLRLRLEIEQRLKSEPDRQLELIQESESQCIAWSDDVRRRFLEGTPDNGEAKAFVSDDESSNALRLLYLVFPTLSFALDEMVEAMRSITIRVLELRLAVCTFS